MPTPYDKTIDKILQLPEPLLREVNDFVDFLRMKHDSDRWRLWEQFSETTKLSESDFSDYLSNLENYEEQLANGEISW
ncbi:MAG: hypothetical protein KME12_11445 [Trichocoleus desertorum ATA4-8-CV12]|jgi:hypothetical protein|nr:hypothetical protein [Trichocoleus desertorum ATA4-8-CV12]